MEIKKLTDLMAALRTPGTGCPWDLKQTFASIVPYTIEEVYEVAEAIDNQDMQELKLELGDLLFQIVFYARLAEEQGGFDFSDVVTAIVEKMTRRHPHVFADAVYESDAAFSKAWEQSKLEERQAKAGIEKSVLDGLSKALPALKCAQKMQSKAAKVGFDWKEIAPVYDKVEEELSEVRQAEKNEDRDNLEEELGDLLFSVVNLVRHLDMDAENVLRKATNKFEGRFRKLESQCLSEHESISDKTENELIEMWEKVKQR